MMGSHGIENQPSSPANDNVPMPSQTISAQSQSEISVTAQSSIPNRSDAEKRKATEVSDQDVNKTKLSVETRSHFEPHCAKANRVVCKFCKFAYSTVTVTTVLAHHPDRTGLPWGSCYYNANETRKLKSQICSH